MRALLIQLVGVPLFGQVILSEIMYDLSGTDSPNEYVELFNLSDSAVNLEGWLIRDQSSTDEILDFGGGLVLPARSYAVIHEGDYEVASGIYSDLIPASALVLSVDDRSIGNQLSVEDSLFLINAAGAIVDSVGWSGDSKPGFSLERVRLDGPSGSENWAISLDSLGTPGRQNSVLPPTVDFAIVSDGVSHTPLFPEDDEVISMTVPIANSGVTTTEGNVTAWWDGLRLTETDVPLLDYGDTTNVAFDIGALPSGIQTIQLLVEADGDENEANDAAAHEVWVSFKSGLLTFNEIHYAPDEGVPEFLEFVNVGTAPINLEAWSISDSDTSKPRHLPPFNLFPSGYVVVAADSSLSTDSNLIVPTDPFPSLNNSGDSVYLFDMTGKIIDSLSFSSDWGGQAGRSLEKLNPSFHSHLAERWGTCVDPSKMTPGVVNSIFLEHIPAAGAVELTPNPFSPDGDGFDDQLFISYNLPFPHAYVTVQIFDGIGRSVRTVAKNMASASEGVIRWDGTTESGQRARIGIYIVKLSATERDGGGSSEWVRTAVLAEPLR